MALMNEENNFGKESLWDLAVTSNTSLNGACIEEKNLIFVGNKGSGKSTIIQRFLNKDDLLKETLALEYSFGRKSGRSLTKETCHVWELGGGTLFMNLLDIHLGRKNTTLIIVLDLSVPDTLWSIIETILTYVYNYFKKKDELSVFHYDPKVHDENIMQYPIPLIIIGCKYDLFQLFEAEKKKQICRTLRSVAHYLSASLIFCSDKDPTTIKKLNEVLHSHGFGGSQWKGHSTDYNKPLLIHAGSDSYDNIGISKNLLTVKTSGLSLDLFKHTYAMVFPQTSESWNIPDDPGKDQRFKEPLIDSLRAQRDEELDKFLFETEQRRKITKKMI